MQYQSLGSAGPQVSSLCLGAMMFGDRTDAAEAKHIFVSAQEAGVNFIDTADLYAQGESERVVGKLVADRRDDWVLATKVGNKMESEPNSGGLSRAWIQRGLDGSLQRLGLDYVDIYYLHVDDHNTSQDETLHALGDAIKQGKIRYWGVSNFRAYRIVSLVLRAEALNIPRPIVCQPYYNAMNRTPEVEILPACAEHVMGVVPYSPLARGVLTGKYLPQTNPPSDTRAGRKDARMMETEFRDESLRIAQQVKVHAEACGMTAGQWAVNWVLANQLVTSVLVGPRTLAQWQEYLGALDCRWSREDEKFLDALVAPGHPSTPGYSDPKYPIRGRIASIA